MNSLRAETRTRNESFNSTRWTLVLAAGDSDATRSQSLEALSELCRIYWRPLYLFLRREGIGAEDAQDLTQGFFAHLIESRAYARADPHKGRFRSFLLGALKHFVAHARAHDRTQKRGGGMILAQLDTAAIAEADARAVSLQAWSAERVYEREWAETLLRQALDRLAEECALAGKDELFKQLNSHLSVIQRSGSSLRRNVSPAGPADHNAAQRCGPAALEVSRDFAGGSGRHGGRSVRG